MQAAAGVLVDEWREAYDLHAAMEAGISLDYRTLQALPALLRDDLIALRLALGAANGRPA